MVFARNSATYLLQGPVISELQLPDFSEIRPKLDDFVLKEVVFTVIKFAGGGCIAIYMGDHSRNRIWPIAYSIVFVEGAYQYFRLVYMIFWKKVKWPPFHDGCSPYNVAIGTLIYFGGLYAFSEDWQRGYKRWIYFLGIAVTGLYLAAESVYKKWNSKANIPLKCCQLVSVPALIACGASYLWYFRNHNEEWMEWLPLVLIFKTGFAIAVHGAIREENPWKPQLLLVRGIELLTGGCIVAVTSAALAIYFSVKGFHSILSISTSFMGYFGVFVIFGSITCFQRYVGMEEDVSSCVGCIATGVVMIFSSGLMVKCMRSNILVYLLFMILAGSGHYLLWQSVWNLYRILPQQTFIRYCQRTLGPLLTICSSVASGYLAYRMGWRYSLMTMPLTCAGIYVTYKGFSTDNQAVGNSRGILGPLLTVCSTVASAYIGYHMGWRYSLMMMPLPCAGIYVAYKGFRRG